MTNKLAQPIYTEKPWGSEIVWALTDTYVCKTIEVDAYKITDLIVHEEKEKSIIVVDGMLSIAMGKCCDPQDLNYYECPKGWSIYIEPGIMHRYGGTDKPVKIIEVSNQGLDSGVTIPEDIDIWRLEQ